jgi:chemotaxis protein methyltransferase CheR
MKPTVKHPESKAGHVAVDLTGLRISERDFTRFSQLIYEVCGIRMPPHKRSMLEARLRKRLRTLGLTSYEEYRDYIFSHEGMVDELTNMIDVVTTNKTDFFREPRHFDFLNEIALPELIATTAAGVDRPLRIWSAGCSSGEEPYTIAMVLEEFAGAGSKLRYQILATDVSTQVLEKAVLGVYHQDKIEPVPLPLRRKYLLKSRQKTDPRVRITPELRAKVQFRHLNFMDEHYAVSDPQDIIFCRNVIIYFDRPTQERFLSRLCRCLAPGGYLMMGHSETLSGMSLPVVQQAPAVYRKR